MIREAIILAGGLGTRLRTAVPELPKSMAPVAGKPFLYYPIEYFRSQGISRFVFSLGYKHEVIEDFLQREYPGLDYTTVVETEPLGTGGAIRYACRQVRSEQVLVLNGDTFFAVDTPALSAFHARQQAECTIALKTVYDSDRYGVVETGAGGRILSFREKKWYAQSRINGGVYALNAGAFLQEDLPVAFSFEKDYLEAFHRDKQFYGLEQDGYFIDIGVPEDYTRAQIELPFSTLYK